MSVTTDAVLESLERFEDPYFTGKNLVERKAVKRLEITGDLVSLDVELGYPAAGIEAQLKQGIESIVKSVDGVDAVELKLSWGIEANKTQNNMPSMHRIKNIIGSCFWERRCW